MRSGNKADDALLAVPGCASVTDGCATSDVLAVTARVAASSTAERVRAEKRSMAVRELKRTVATMRTTLDDHDRKMYGYASSGGTRVSRASTASPSSPVGVMLYI
jgi:hypothetical protein